MVFHLLDPAELSLSFDDGAIFYDVESQRELYVDPDLIRKHYKQRMSDHLAAIESICDKQGVDYHRVTTDTPLELVLFDFLSDRQMIKRTVMRREGRRG